VDMPTHSDTDSEQDYREVIGVSNEARALIPREDILEMDYESLLSLMGVGRYHYGVIMACAMSNAADAVEIMAISFVISAGKEDLNMSDFDEGVLTAAIFLGMMFGGWIWGSMADQARFGRKKVLFWSLLINGIFGLLSAVSVNFYMLLVVRFCGGLGVGGSIPVTFTYAAEFVPKEKRGMYLAMLAVSWPFAATMTALFAYAIIPNVSPQHLGSVTVESWRLFLIPCCVPAFAASLVFHQFVDHSPKWLIYTKHNYREASRVLIKIFNINNDGNSNRFDADLFDPNTLRSWALRDMDPESTLLVSSGSVSLQHVHDDLVIDEDGGGDGGKQPNGPLMVNQDAVHKSFSSGSSSPVRSRSSAAAVSWDGLRKVWVRTTLLFSPKHRRSHILASIVYFTLSFGFYGLAEWLPTYFGSKSDVNEYLSSIATSAAQFPGALMTGWILEYCCDRKVLLSLSVGLGASTIIAIPYLSNGMEIVALTCVFNGVTVCAWSTLDVITPELSPTNIRSTAFGFLCAVGRIGAILGNLTFGAFGHDDIASALTVCGILLAVGTASCTLLPSTKGISIK